MDENLRLLKSEPPEEIVFVGPHEKGSQSKLSLTNVGKENVYFKVLTTDPLAFCVKPKMGKVQPGETTQVCITLRNDDPKYYLEKQPKFKILTIENSEKDQDPKLLWNGDKSENISSLRFSCNFVELDPSGNVSPYKEAKEAEERKKNMDDSRTANYETSGSSMSLKEESTSKKKSTARTIIGFQVKHLVMGFLAVFVAYMAATSYMKGSLQF